MVLSNPQFFPYESPSTGQVQAQALYDYLAARPGQFPGFPLQLGTTDQERSQP